MVDEQSSALAFIFARGGSKGIPGKNITLFGWQALIAHSIEQALCHPDIGRVVVSTDDAAIATVACEYGAEVPFLRPPELASDTASEWQAWQHAVSFCPPLPVMSSPPLSACQRQHPCETSRTSRPAWRAAGRGT